MRTSFIILQDFKLWGCLIVGLTSTHRRKSIGGLSIASSTNSAKSTAEPFAVRSTSILLPSMNLRATPANCPDDVLITNYQTTPSKDQFVDITNVGYDTIFIGDCTVIGYDSISKASIAAATVRLEGALNPGETRTIQFLGALPETQGGIGVYNGTPPVEDTPIAKLLPDEITSIMYLQSDAVLEIRHIAAEWQRHTYTCIYGGSGLFKRPFQPVGYCFCGLTGSCTVFITSQH